MEGTTPRMSGELHIEYEYSMGKAAAEFFAALRDRRMLGAACTSCERVAVPPKSFCEYCFVPVDRLVEVEQEGTIEAVTVVAFAVAGAPPPPYCVAYVRLGGATSSVANYVHGVDLGSGEELPVAAGIGSRVSVVFGDQPEGRVTDFWFEPLKR